MHGFGNEKTIPSLKERLRAKLIKSGNVVHSWMSLRSKINCERKGGKLLKRVGSERFGGFADDDDGDDDDDEVRADDDDDEDGGNALIASEDVHMMNAGRGALEGYNFCPAVPGD